MNSKISIAKEKNISGVPFFEIGKDFISGAQSLVNLENVIKSNLNLNLGQFNVCYNLKKLYR